MKNLCLLLQKINHCFWIDFSIAYIFYTCGSRIWPSFFVCPNWSIGVWHRNYRHMTTMFQNCLRNNYFFKEGLHSKGSSKSSTNTIKDTHWENALTICKRLLSIVSGKTPLFVIGSFCTSHSFCPTIGFSKGSFVWKCGVFNGSTFN